MLVRSVIYRKNGWGFNFIRPFHTAGLETNLLFCFSNKKDSAEGFISALLVVVLSVVVIGIIRRQFVFISPYRVKQIS